VGGLFTRPDSQSGVPVRELFGLSAVVVPLMLLQTAHHEGLTAEQIFVIMTWRLLVIRFGVRTIFKH